jgi:hypothetical protein
LEALEYIFLVTFGLLIHPQTLGRQAKEAREKRQKDPSGRAVEEKRGEERVLFTKRQGPTTWRVIVEEAL